MCETTRGEPTPVTDGQRGKKKFLHPFDITIARFRGMRAIMSYSTSEEVFRISTLRIGGNKGVCANWERDGIFTPIPREASSDFDFEFRATISAGIPEANLQWIRSFFGALTCLNLLD